MEDARLTLYFHTSPANNISLNSIMQASQSNDAVFNSNGINNHLIDTIRRQQSLLFDQKLADFGERFRNAPDSVQSRMLSELNRELDLMKREEQYQAEVQDPPQMTEARRTFGKGGKRRRTAAEQVQKELEQNDKEAWLQSSTSVSSQPKLVSAQSTSVSAPEIVDLTSAPTTPQRPLGPLIMTFSRDGRIIQSPQPPPPLLQHRPQSSKRPYQIPSPVHAIPTINPPQIEDTDVGEDSPGVRRTRKVRRPKQHYSPSLCTRKSPQKSPSRGQIKSIERAVLERSEVLTKPVKRRKKDN
jgi:hypothetical protein